jgi:PKHD-type hydroxylase
MLLAISAVLREGELEELTGLLEAGKFVDARKAAGPRAARAKSNLQFEKTDGNRDRLNSMIAHARQRSEVFATAVLPQRIHRPPSCPRGPLSSVRPPPSIARHRLPVG